MDFKQILKKRVKGCIRNSSKLRQVIFRLNDVASQSEDVVTTSASVGKKEQRYDHSVFTEKSMYSGYMIDYLSYKILSKEERAGELKRLFYRYCHYYLDLENPLTFNQKLQWLKLNYDDPRMSRCVDKCEFKRYIEETIGKEYVVPSFGEWEHENDVEFSKLPKQFVLKSNVQSDGRHIIVVKDKDTLDIDKLKTVMSSWLLRKNTLCSSYCHAYHSIQPKILAEQYIDGFDDSITDYKFMCFNGKAEMLFVVADRENSMSVNFYDLDWNLLPFTRKYPNSRYPLKKPKNFNLMVELANKLAEPFPFVRVDFYESADEKNVYVGELTFYPGGGYETFEPLEWDYKLGEMIKLPEANV